MAADEILTLAVNENLHNLRKEAAKKKDRPRAYTDTRLGTIVLKYVRLGTMVCKTRD